jgi:hypothetical protein
MAFEAGSSAVALRALAGQVEPALRWGVQSSMIARKAEIQVGALFVLQQ